MTELEEVLEIAESFEYIRILKAGLAEMNSIKMVVWLKRFFRIGVIHSRYVVFRDGCGEPETCPLLYWCSIKLRELSIHKV